MNEVSQISLPYGDPPPAPPTSSRGRILFSNPCNLLIRAMAKASLTMKNPIKNKTVTVNSRRTGRTYTYKYSTLDVVLDCVRIPLGENGMWIPAMGADDDPELVVTVYHESGQWASSTMRLRPDEPTKEGIAGAATFWRRQMVQWLTNLSAEDDDDGASAAGNDIYDGDQGQRYAGHGDRPSEDSHDRPESDRLAAAAADAASFNDGLGLLRMWLSHRARVTQLRTAQPEAWKASIDSVAGGLHRSIGTDIAAAWKSFAIAATREQEKAARAKWDGPWDVTLQAFRKTAPAGYADLVRHMNACGEAIALLPKPDVLTEAVASVVTDLAAVQIPAADVPPDEPQQGGFAHHVIDANGDIATDLRTSPQAWAVSYGRVWAGTAPDLRNALTEHNTGALTEADHDPDANAILNQIYDDAADEADPDETPERPLLTHEDALVTVPLGRSGKPDLASYEKALRVSIANQVQTPADLVVWLAANETVYQRRDLGSAIKARAMQMVTERRRGIGMQLPEGV
jgi:hypothetical protein